MAGSLTDIEKRLWEAADQLRANSPLRSSEYSAPVLGLIFLRYADHKFGQAHEAIESAGSVGRRRRAVGKADYQARGVLFVPEDARYQRLLELPEQENVGRAINEAMKAIEEENEDLRGVLPRNYHRLDSAILISLLKLFASIPMEMNGDLIGRIYEYFLGRFSLSEGRRGGEFFTPESVVRLIVEIMEPYHGRILDPACGSAGMFVQSANFVKRHRKDPGSEISIYGQDKEAEAVRLSRMSLAVNGLAGDIRQGNTYYEDVHRSPGKFDFVMANPPFNVNGIDHEKLRDDRRFPFGIPSVDNGNYLWIQIFWAALNEHGRAGFVMANTAADARGSESDIRKQLVEDRSIDVMVAVGPNFFYTVALPCTLWFLDKGKKDTARADQVLFLDARHIYEQVDRAHREFTPAQIEFLANVVRLYRGEPVETGQGREKLLEEYFPDGEYHDVAGLSRVATIDEIREQGYSLNPGRYVGVAAREDDGFEFATRLEELNEELELLNADAHELQERITESVTKLIEANP